MNERYDNIKELVKQSRLINEQLNAEKLGPINVAKDIEAKIGDDYETALDSSKEKEQETEYVQRYRISGSILAIHGKEKSDTQLMIKLPSKILWMNLQMKYLTW